MTQPHIYNYKHVGDWHSLVKSKIFMSPQHPHTHTHACTPFPQKHTLAHIRWSRKVFANLRPVRLCALMNNTFVNIYRLQTQTACKAGGLWKTYSSPSTDTHINT